jgi:hypothetical protein
MIWKIIIGLLLFFTVRIVYRSFGFYHVMSKTEYKDLENDDKWSQVFTGKYVDCAKYVKNAKLTPTDLLGFKQTFKIVKANF